MTSATGESSASIRERVQVAQERQLVRFEGTDIIRPVQDSGLSSRARTGTIVPCKNRDYRNSDMPLAEACKFYILVEAGTARILFMYYRWSILY
jgi:hypothetical protein